MTNPRPKVRFKQRQFYLVRRVPLAELPGEGYRLMVSLPPVHLHGFGAQLDRVKGDQFSRKFA